LRILYIDDDAGVRRLVERLLERREHVVVTAGSGEEGVERAREGSFDVIAVDHYMPGMDGLDTLAALKKSGISSPVVYVTGSEESSVAVGALKSGAEDYVVKTGGGDFVDLLERAFNTAAATSQLRREKAEADAALKESNERLQILLREVNHRVANSLQIVSTMVAMQARLLSDDKAREALQDTQRRIDAIAQVHRRLYSSNEVQSVAMDEYLAALVAELQETWSTPDSPREIRLNAEPLRLHTDKAVSLGVIVTELVSNACKYAYPEGSAGEVRVNLAREPGERFQLAVEDDGRGMNPNSPPQGTGLGSKLIVAMARSLSSRVEYDHQHAGVRAVLVAAA
jgi:two-component sensor histidine kinase